MHKQEKEHQSTLFYSKIQIVPSYLKIFRVKNPTYLLTLGEFDILLALTLYPVRLLEQAFIDFIQPVKNGRAGKYDTTVFQKYTSLDKARLKTERTDNRGSIPIEIYNLDGI